MNPNAKEIFELLISNYSDRELFKESVSELRKWNVKLDFRISENTFREEPNYNDLLDAFDNARKWNREKIAAVKGQDFENAATYREHELTEIERINKLGYEILYYMSERFVFKVNFNKDRLTLFVEIQPSSKNFLSFLRRLQKRLN